MKPVEKPRIRYIARFYFYSVALGPVWVCSDGVGVGRGATPTAAYSDWLSDRPKTYTEYWARKFFVAIFG